MKTKIISTLKKELLLVELPEEWTFNIYKDQIGFCNEINKPIEQIKGSYTLLGSPDEIKEEDVIFLVETDEISDVGDYRHQLIFIDYQDEEKAFETALESFHSALESEIYWNVNPIKIIPRGEASEHDRVKNQNEFNEAQEKTFDKKRTLIFVKN